MTPLMALRTSLGVLGMAEGVHAFRGTVSIYDFSTVRIPGLKGRKRGVYHDAFDGAQDNLWQLWAWQEELQALGQHCQGL